MDDGTPLCLKVHLDREKGQGTFDLTGTGPKMYGNLNAPRAITFDAIIYVLWTLVNQDIPLNQGCLAPIEVILPEGTILSASGTAATVAGNTDTSQRVTDLVLRAFKAAGASQGTCNNLTFGFGGQVVDGKATPGFGYYEVSHTSPPRVFALLPFSASGLSRRCSEQPMAVDNRWRSGRRPFLARSVWCARTHDEHRDYRSGDA